MTYNKLSSYKTVVFGDDDEMKVVYQSTVIVKWTYDTVTLNSGGWQTVTTKKKMNQASYQFNLGYQVYQKDFEWFVDYKGITLPFFDGIILQRRVT